MKRILLILIALTMAALSFSQVNTLKGDGQVFWEEDFDWADPDAPQGWTLPEGWIIEDNSSDDNGFVWVWTRDSMQGPFSKRDGGYILNSTTRENGFLSIDLDNLNAYKDYMEMQFVNSSITLPRLDCSDHPSVIISLEQMFKYFNSPRMVIEVSNDDGAHWAEFDLKMGTSSGTNVMNLQNNEVAHYIANLSDVAGGQSDVIIKLTWEGSMLYFWMLDDIKIFEGWDYDLKMNHCKVELIDDRHEDSPGFYYMMPKTQIQPLGSFEGSVTNFGEYEMSDVKFNVLINKNHVEQFSKSSESVPYIYFGESPDTLTIDDVYTPVDYGHYEITFSMTGNEEEQAPANNTNSYFFHVSDSVFARTPDVKEADESPWRNLYQYTHEGDIMGVEFSPTDDCTASSISAYISRSNLEVDFKFVLLEIINANPGEVEINEILSSEVNWVDQAVLDKGWITLPLDPDGIGENLVAGRRYIAGVQFWTYIEEDDLKERADAFYVGATQTYPASYDKQWLFQSYTGEWTQGSNYNKMIRLNIDNHDNIIDGINSSESALILRQNYPNPFTNETVISYSLQQKEDVTVEIQDLTGRTIQLFNEGIKPAGQHTIQIMRNDLEAGIYSYSITAGSFTSTKRMIVK